MRKSGHYVREMLESFGGMCSLYFTQLYYQSFLYCIFRSKRGERLYKGHLFSYFLKIQVRKFQLEAS